VTIDINEISRTLIERVKQTARSWNLEEVGSVIQIGDGIARIYGLEQCMAGELLEFDTGD
jgi:F-type H+-transporting ATPase subunit alpha